MGGGCRMTANRETLIVGGYCEHSCFSGHGGCEASSELDAIKSTVHCELKPGTKDKLLVSMEQLNVVVDDATKRGKSVFLYTPDMFSPTYFESCYKKLPTRNDTASIAVNAGVRTLVDTIAGDWNSVREKGITEIWVGVETANVILRKKYHKPEFTNEEVVRLTKEGRAAGINICWYLVDGCEDTTQTRIDTWQLMKDADPYRIHIGHLERLKVSA